MSREDPLRELRQITNNLPPLQVMVKARDRAYTEYQIDGTCFGLGLWNDGDAAAQRAFMSKDSTFNQHIHPENEWLVVYKGHLVIYIDDVPHKLGPGDGIHIPPHTAHSVEASEDTWMFGIAIPASEGYPDGR